MYKAYKGQVQFFLVYIREAHPSRGDKVDRRGQLAIAQPKTMEERVIAADKCMKGLKLTIPILLDTIDGAYLKSFGGFQAGTAVIDIDGKIAYWTRGGPWDCKPKEAKAALKKLLAAGGGAVAEKWAAVKVPRPKAKPASTRPASGNAKKTD